MTDFQKKVTRSKTVFDGIRAFVEAASQTENWRKSYLNPPVRTECLQPILCHQRKVFCLNHPRQSLYDVS